MRRLYPDRKSQIRDDGEQRQSGSTTILGLGVVEPRGPLCRFSGPRLNHRAQFNDPLMGRGSF